MKKKPCTSIKTDEFANSVVTLCLNALTSTDIVLVKKSLGVIAALGDSAVDAIPAVAKLLDEPGSAIRERAVETLVSIGGDIASTTPRLLKMALSWEGQKDDASHFAAWALGKIGDNAAIEGLLQLARTTGSQGPQIDAVHALGTIHTLEPFHLDELMAIGTMANEPWIKNEVIHCIARYANDNDSVVDFLLSCLRHAERGVRSASLRGLEKSLPNIRTRIAILAYIEEENDEELKHTGLALIAHWLSEGDRLSEGDAERRGR